MELIIADYNGDELGVIMDYTLDLAYGYSENNFELTINSEEDIYGTNRFIYYPQTEYGGIIDSVFLDTKNNIVKYSGRTWQGILDSKIITPINKYRILDGPGYDILNRLIREFNLNDVFEADTQSTLRLNNLQLPRYIPFYSGLQAALLNNDAKLVMYYDNTISKVKLSIISNTDYTDLQELNRDTINYRAKQYVNSVNHLICLGSGELEKRHVIHLFTDKRGAVMPYSTSAEPKQDSDYILDGTNQLYTGIEDITAVYDYPNAETKENYKQVEIIPTEWPINYVNYYTKDSSGNYSQLTREYQDEYEKLTTVPPDWNLYYHCQDYYENKNGRYVNVEPVSTIENYYMLQNKPNDWETNYSDYYEYYSDGVTEEYRSVKSDSYSDYIIQTIQPSDWEDNKGTYYVKIDTFSYTYKIKTKSNGKWKTQTKTYSNQIAQDNTDSRKVSLVSSKKTGTKYLTVSQYANDIVHVKLSSIAWEVKKFYTKQTKSKPPTFRWGKYYGQSVSTSAPTFVPNKYYKLNEHVEKIPSFSLGEIYELVYDNYAELVEGGINRLHDLWNLDTIETDFESDVGDFDVNDLVGNQKIKAYITKKIIKTKNNVVTVSYITGQGGK